MEIVVNKVYNVKCCNDCPHMKVYVDYSVDKDKPIFVWYCSKEKHLERRGLGKIIDIGLSRFQKCDIPNWCPEKKK